MILLNLGQEAFRIEPGDRIAQLVVARYERVEWQESELGETRRGEGGSAPRAVSGRAARAADRTSETRSTFVFRELPRCLRVQ